MTLLIAFMLGIFIDMESPIIDAIKMLLPGGMVFSYLEFVELRKFPLITLMGKVLYMPSVLFIINGITFFISTLLVTLNYRRR